MDINYMFVTLLVCLNQCTGYNVPGSFIRGPGPPPPLQYRPEPSVPSRYGPEPSPPSRYGPEPSPPSRYGPDPILPSRYGPEPSVPSRYGPEPSIPSRYGPEPSPPPFLRPESRPAGFDPDIRPPPPPYGTIHQPWQSNNNYQEKPPWQQQQNNYGSRPSFQPPFAPNYQQNQIQPFNPQGRPPYPAPPLNNQGRPSYQGNNPYQPSPPPPFNKPGLPPYQPVITTTPTPTKSTPKPIDVMADVTNELGAKILLDHANSRKNFVFSPYGVSSVLAVLHEGSTGDSARQLANVLNLPKEIETVRVGMRDLHRHLKSYFGHNGFLQGVDLSHNNTSLRADFVPYLRLYGFYVDDKGNQSTMLSVTTTMAPVTTTMLPATTVPVTTTTEQTVTTQQTNAGEEEAEDSDMEGTNAQQLVQQVDEKTEEPEEEKPTEESNTEEKPAEEMEESNKPDEEEKPAEESNNEESVTEEAPDEVMQETTMQMVEETSMEPMEQDEETTTSAPEDYDVTTEESSRRKRASFTRYTSSIPQFKRHANWGQPRAIHHSLFPDIELNNGIDSATKTPSPYNPNAQKRPFRLFNGDFSTPVTVIEKREFLPFASLPQLRAVAVLLPLDEPRYGMLLLLPTDGRAQALKQLAEELTQTPLRNVLDALRPSRVQVTLPAFAADGTVILTSSLQKLGVWDIFDPRLARLNGMSNYAGLFVRDLEQHIHMDFGTVRSLHTRVVTARSTSEVMNAMRPFFYFVIDRETKTALMAGKIEDPSDSRVF